MAQQGRRKAKLLTIVLINFADEVFRVFDIGLGKRSVSSEHCPKLLVSVHVELRVCPLDLLNDSLAHSLRRFGFRGLVGGHKHANVGVEGRFAKECLPITARLPQRHVSLFGTLWTSTSEVRLMNTRVAP